MKARYAYPLLFLFPGVMLALLACVAVAGAGAGVLWLFVYGDGPWPPSASTALMAMAATAGVLTLATVGALSYAFGKQREHRGGTSRSHVLAALGLSLGLPLLVLLHQWQVGNLGRPPGPANNASGPALPGEVPDQAVRAAE